MLVYHKDIVGLIKLIELITKNAIYLSQKQNIFLLLTNLIEYQNDFADSPNWWLNSEQTYQWMNEWWTWKTDFINIFYWRS